MIVDSQPDVVFLDELLNQRKGVARRFANHGRQPARLGVFESAPHRLLLVRQMDHAATRHRQPRVPAFLRRRAALFRRSRRPRAMRAEQRHIAQLQFLRIRDHFLQRQFGQRISGQPKFKSMRRRAPRLQRRPRPSPCRQHCCGFDNLPSSQPMVHKQFIRRNLRSWQAQALFYINTPPIPPTIIPLTHARLHQSNPPLHLSHRCACGRVEETGLARVESQGHRVSNFDNSSGRRSHDERQALRGTINKILRPRRFHSFHHRCY